MITKLAIYGAVWLAAVTLVTQAVGRWFAYPPQFGGLRVGEWSLYVPGQVLVWHDLLRDADRCTIDAASLASVLAAFAVGWRAVLDLSGPSGSPGRDRAHVVKGKRLTVA